MCVILCVQRQWLEQMVSGGSASHAADDLIQLLETTISEMSQLGSTRGNEQLITAALHQIQAHDFLSIYLSLSVCLSVCLSMRILLVKV